MLEYWNFGILGSKIGKDPSYLNELKGNPIEISPIIHFPKKVDLINREYLTNFAIKYTKAFFRTL